MSPKIVTTNNPIICSSSPTIKISASFSAENLKLWVAQNQSLLKKELVANVKMKKKRVTWQKYINYFNKSKIIGKES